MAWVLLFASAAAVLLTGVTATVVLLTDRVPEPTAIPTTFWPRLLGAAGLTVAGISLRALRWVYLLRRTETRIPIRDAYIGYLSGFALLFAPFFLGEIGVRAWVLRRRGGVPTGVTAVLSLWERWFDLLALVGLAGGLWLIAGAWTPAAVCLAGLAAFLSVAPLRTRLLGALTGIVNRTGAALGGRVVPPLPRVAGGRTSLVTWLTSVVAWLLPAVGFRLLVGGFPVAVTGGEALLAFATATLRGGLSLVPGGVLVTGTQLLEWLAAGGVDAAAAAVIVLGSRLATVGVSTAFGLLFLLIHLRDPRAAAGDHFDAIADAYDVQIAEPRRLALLTRKTAMMREWLTEHGVGSRGIDVGCGQGWYVGRMRELGFDVGGIDYSAGQVSLARGNLGDASLVRVGSALAIPAADASVDFVYSINVLHHLPSLEAQRAAFREMLRVLRPGGVIFLHEINTTNPLFRFYMGYVFPSLNCIDEGVERWLLPRALSAYTDAAVVDIRYFTFFPDFLPQALVHLGAPVERWLEHSPLRAYSAHYMAVLRKPA